MPDLEVLVFERRRAQRDAAHEVTAVQKKLELDLRETKLARVLVAPELCERAPTKALRHDAKPGSIEVQYLGACTSAVGKEIETAGQRIPFHLVSNQRRESFEAAAKIGRRRVGEYWYAIVDSDHASAFTTVATSLAFNPSMRTPLGRTTTTPAFFRLASRA